MAWLISLRSISYLYLKQFCEGLQALFLTQKEFFICLPFQAAKKKFTIYQLAFTALMAALVFVSTQFNIKIPLGMGVTSMISFGNIFCILSALLLGPIYGGLAAGIGSFFFDLLDPVFITSAPFTLVFKFIMAFVCGKIAYSGGHTADSHKRNLIASIAGLLAYIVLHLGKTFIANALLGSAFLPNLTTVGYSALPSIINAVIATIVAVPLAAALRLALKKAHFLDKLQPQH